MLADEDDDRLSIINTDADVYWNELAIRVTGDVRICINGEVTGLKGYNLTTDTYYKISDYVMSSGSAHVSIHGSDFIDIEGTAASLSDITVTIIHDVTDTTLGTYTFASIINTIDKYLVPIISFLADEDDDRLIVTTGSIFNADAYWDDFAIRVTGDVTIRINGEVTTSLGKTLSADTYYQVSDDMMSSGNAHVKVHDSDFIDLEGTSASLSDVTFTFIHDVTDTTLGTYTYSSIVMNL